MLQLHGALDDDGLVVWCRHVDAAGGWAPGSRHELRDALTPCGISADDVRTVTATLRTPAPVDVDALLAPHSAVVDVVRASRSSRFHGGDEWPVLRHLVQHAAACVVRQELVPALERGGSEHRAVWRTAPRPASRDSLDVLVARLPGVALAVDRADAAPRSLALPRPARVRRFVDRVADALVRAAAPAGAWGNDDSIHGRWIAALTSEDTTVAGPTDALDRAAEAIDAWADRVLRRTSSPFRLCVRLEEPDDPSRIEEEPDADAWFVRYLVQARDDPSVLIDLADAWKPRGADVEPLRARGFHQGEHLVAPLAEAARLNEHIAASLREREPGGVTITTAEAHVFLTETVPLLEQADIGVFVPAWWRGRGGRFQVGVRAHAYSGFDGGRRSLDSLNLATLVGYDWRVAIGELDLTRGELTKLAAQKAPLVHTRGRWVEVDQRELHHAIRHVEQMVEDPTTPSRGHAQATVGDLVRMSLVGGVTDTGVRILGAEGDGIPELLARVRAHETPDPVPPPTGLRATLRPYQQRGFEWLRFMTSIGLGACLADDMGLGKSVQTLAVIQDAWERAAASGTARTPTLIVAPTSVLANWHREAQRFTPDLPVVLHHGGGRLRGAEFTARAAESAIVITSYQLLARDIELLGQTRWRIAVLDEAQQIKNPGTSAARAARSLVADARIALSGTPVENHVGDLWSIMEFLVPGLLGNQANFRRRYLVPIQTGGFPEAADRLRALVAPFVLRRTKAERSVIADLPERIETTEYCSLTTEQVTLYEAIVRDAAKILRGSATEYAGVERRGMILATIAKLKQACNHPAQLLGDNSRIEGRSGKLARLEALVEDILERGERTLIFTQFVEMGTLLQASLEATFGREVLFLHGGTPRTQRDAMVERFQSAGGDAPPIFVLSLKAGGSGLNLTAATHVIHYDRWWNPATEQQASDRAHRIGQTRDVQVHALVCAGTVEERIDTMLRQKRSVADTIVGSGETWITELDDEELLDVVELRDATLLQDGRLDSIDEREWRRASL